VPQDAYDAFNRGDIPAVTEAMTSDIEWNEPGGGRVEVSPVGPWLTVTSSEEGGMSKEDVKTMTATARQASQKSAPREPPQPSPRPAHRP
jgi:hypothetical protein